MERILIVRTDNMGDLLLSTAVLPLIRQKIPGAHLAMLVKPYTAELLEHNPYLDEVIEYTGDFFRDLRNLRYGRYDTVLFLYPRISLALLGCLAGIRTRIGTARRCYSFLFNRRVNLSRRRMDKHELEYNLDLLAPLGIELSGKSPGPIFRLSSAERKWGTDYLKGLGVRPGNKLVVLHPGGFGSALLWPPAHYAKLIGMLAALRRVKIILAGGKGEKQLLKRIADDSGVSPLVIGGDLSLRQYAAVIDGARLFVSASTGPMHLASCLRPRLVSIFCPINACTPSRWGPYTKRAEVLMPLLPECQSCRPDECEHHPCMEKLTPEKVYQHCRKAIIGGTG